MSRIEIEARVSVLANDTVRLADMMMERNPRLDHKSEFVLYVGISELNAIRYIAGDRYRRLAEDDERFVGCTLIGVRRDTYYHLTVREPVE